jgi:hypothetical protein
MKVLSKKQKSIETLRALKLLMRTTFTDKINEAVRNAVNDTDRPIKHLELGDDSILNEIIKEFKLK